MITKDLKDQHKELFDALDEVKKLGISSKEGQNKLLSSREILLAHIKKEDSEFYPVLKKAAEGNSSLKQTLDSFASDMGKISKFAMDFFNKYSKGVDDSFSFAKEFGSFVATLSIRMQKEENILYREFDKLNKN